MAPTIERYKPELLSEILELFQSYFPTGDRLLTPEYLQWLYGENPVGKAHVAYVKEGQKLIAFMALIPVTLIRGSQTLPSYFVVNVLVHPAHQGRHLFSKLITAAKSFAAGTGAALMGHPNPAALKAWQRARMHFQNPLEPHWPKPRLVPTRMTRRRVLELEESSQLWAALQRETAAGSSWQIAITPLFLTWRFLRHPATSYAVHMLEVHGRAVGVQITRKLRPGVNLLVDSFVLPEFEREASRCLPWLTIWMLPSADPRVLSCLRTPLKKTMPFFLTCEHSPIRLDEAISIGLSASDL